MEESEYRYDVIEIQTSVGTLLPWLERLISTMEPFYSAGLVKVYFDPNGVRTEIYDRFGDMISEDISDLRELKFDVRHQGSQRENPFPPRVFRYWDIQDMYRFVCRYDRTPEQPLVICMESDEQDVGIKLGGLMEFFGCSHFDRPGCIILNNRQEA